jgi:hypothetical protein
MNVQVREALLSSLHSLSVLPTVVITWRPTKFRAKLSFGMNTKLSMCSTVSFKNFIQMSPVYTVVILCIKLNQITSKKTRHVGLPVISEKRHRHPCRKIWSAKLHMDALDVSGKTITKWFWNSVRVYTGFINIRKDASGDSSEHGTERLERKYTGNSWIALKQDSTPWS